jgi:hypothetical protein
MTPEQMRQWFVDRGTTLEEATDVQLLDCCIEKFERLPEHWQEIAGHRNAQRFPGAANCALCVRYSETGKCPLRPSCKTGWVLRCVDEYEAVSKATSKERWPEFKKANEAMVRKLKEVRAECVAKERKRVEKPRFKVGDWVMSTSAATPNTPVYYGKVEGFTVFDSKPEWHDQEGDWRCPGNVEPCPPRPSEEQLAEWGKKIVGLRKPEGRDKFVDGSNSAAFLRNDHCDCTYLGNHGYRWIVEDVEQDEIRVEVQQGPYGHYFVQDPINNIQLQLSQVINSPYFAGCEYEDEPGYRSCNLVHIEPAEKLGNERTVHPVAVRFKNPKRGKK